MIDSQNERIFEHLKKGGTLTPLEALDRFGCFRLASRINDIRNLGFNIVTDNVTRNKKRFASYRMVK